MSKKPPTRGPYVTALETVADYRHELNRLYRDARKGRAKTADASRLAHILNLAARLLADSEIEQRIAALENSEAVGRPSVN